jgi:hypothetical protein
VLATSGFAKNVINLFPNLIRMSPTPSGVKIF